GASAEAFFVRAYHRIERAAPGAADKIYVVRRIRPRAHRPQHVVHVVGIDVVIDDDDVASEICAGATLGGDDAGLLGVARIALLDRHRGKKSALKTSDAANIRHAAFFSIAPDKG